MSNLATKLAKYREHIRNTDNPHNVTGDQLAVDDKLGPCLPKKRTRLNKSLCPHLVRSVHRVDIENGDIWLNDADEVCIQSDGQVWRLSPSGWTT